MNSVAVSSALALALVALTPAARAQGSGSSAQFATSQPASGNTAAPASAEPDFLVLYFATGSTVVRQQDRLLLDKAARLYRDAHPVIMIVAGSSDTVGDAAANLTLSDARAQAVFHELVARGIPASRFQVLAKGATEQAVRAPDGTAEPGNRSVEIHWR